MNSCFLLASFLPHQHIKPLKHGFYYQDLILVLYPLQEIELVHHTLQKHLNKQG